MWSNSCRSRLPSPYRRSVAFDCPPGQPELSKLAFHDCGCRANRYINVQGQLSLDLTCLLSYKTEMVSFWTK
jgi:hypothetical protein